MNEKNDITIKIMDRTFQIKCPPEKISDLYNAAKYLDEKITELQANDKVIALDNIITIAALNITHELLIQKKQNSYHIEDMSQQLLNIQDEIEKALNEEEK